MCVCVCVYVPRIIVRIISNFIVLRNFGKVIFDFSRKYNGKLELSQAELDVSFLESCQCFNVFPKFICFKLPNVSKCDVNAIRKRLLKSASKKRCKEKIYLQK